MKNILVAPLNWGLGHATRCIPIIKALEQQGFNPIIASDGVALALLKKEFPHLISVELPGYNISYSENGKNFKWKLIAQLPKMFRAVRNEKKEVRKLVSKYNINGIISDNRLGVHSKHVPSVFITHQLRVLSGKTSWFTTKVHTLFIAKFNQCWVPDVEKSPNLSGKLGHLEDSLKNTFYLGPLSRFEKEKLPIKHDLMVILSGPEPQRTLLEVKLIAELKTFSKPILFVKGNIEKEQKIWKEDHFTFYNFMNSEQLNTAFNESELVLCRSGYTTVMDLAKLEKKAFFIPTPGQFEQEYLARKYTKVGIAPSCNQDDFKLAMLSDVAFYKGFKNYAIEIDWNNLFSLFKN